MRHVIEDLLLLSRAEGIACRPWFPRCPSASSSRSRSSGRPRSPRETPRDARFETGARTLRLRGPAPLRARPRQRAAQRDSLQPGRRKRDLRGGVGADSRREPGSRFRPDRRAGHRSGHLRRGGRRSSSASTGPIPRARGARAARAFGLPICREILRLFKGEIRVAESSMEPRSRSAFRAPASPDREQRPTGRPATTCRIPRRGRPRRIAGA